MSAAPRRPKTTLARLRRPAIGWLQLFITLFWTLTPAFRTGAIYVADDTSPDNPYWVPLSPSDIPPAGGPEMGDADGNGIEDWRDAFNTAKDDGTVVWWVGANVVVNGLSTPFVAQWRPGGEVDSDSDGIPDGLDEYPSDPTNFSYYWGGGQVRFNDHLYQIPTRWFAGTGVDDNGNGVPDCMENMLWTMNGTAYLWPGGTFLIEGQYSFFEPVYFDSDCDCGDDDADGIPNAIDPYVNDAWNGTQFWWDGGEYIIDGGVTTYGAEWHAGFRARDTDGDGIPDTSGDDDLDGFPDSIDPYPWDHSNNSSWWPGGNFTIDGILTSLPGAWYATTTEDADNDGIPDSLDPYPDDSNNGAWWWEGGEFRVNGVLTPFPALWISTADGDGDADGIPDSLDEHPADPSNNSVEFGGGTYLVDGSATYVAPGWSAVTDGDPDQDAIPSPLDPQWEVFNAPYTEPPVVTHWAGGTFLFENVMTTWLPADYPGLQDIGDQDGDGIPNFLDPYNDDGNNNSPDWFYWGGGTFRIENEERVLYAGWCYGPLDENGNFPDSDGDGIPNSIDPYPNNYFNGSVGYFWPPFVNGQPQTFTYPMEYGYRIESFTTSPYGVEWLDTDEDGIPDGPDPFPNDVSNRNDTDADGIPDSVEGNYYGTLNASDPADAGTTRYVNGRTDGLTWLQAFIHRHLDTLYDDGIDADQDGMRDRYEAFYGLSPTSPFDAVDAPIGGLNPEDETTPGHFVLNVERARAWFPLGGDVSEQEYLEMTGHSPGEGISHNPAKSVAENDWDGDGVSNKDEVWLGADLRDGGARPSDDTLLTAYLTGSPVLSMSTLIHFLPQFLASTRDTDGDDIPDMVEKRIGRNWQVHDSGDPFLDDPEVTWLTLFQAGKFDLVWANPLSPSMASAAPLPITLAGGGWDATNVTYAPVPGFGPAHGSLAGFPDADVTYTPNNNPPVADSFRYRVTATSTYGTFTADATVSISYDPPPPLVVTASPGTFSVEAGKTYTFDLEASVSREGVPITYSISQGPTKGTIGDLDGNQGTYTAGENAGADSFWFTATATDPENEETASASAKFTITITPANTIIASPTGGTSSEGQPVDIQLGAMPERAEGYTFTIVAGPSHGTLGDIDENGVVTYTPDAGYEGEDTFTYTASDGTRTSAPATATIIVEDEYQPPTPTEPSVSITAYSPGTVAAPGCAVSGNIVPFLPNEDNDEAPTSTQNPPPKDNANATIGADDDDIVKVNLKFSPGTYELRAADAEITITLPTTAYRVFRRNGASLVEVTGADHTVNYADGTAASGDLNAIVSPQGLDLFVETRGGAFDVGDIVVEADGTIVDESTAENSDPIGFALAAAMKLFPVQVKEVSFDGPVGDPPMLVLSSDTNLTQYSAPHWVDVDGDGIATTNPAIGEKNYPTTFTRNTVPRIGAKFRVSDTLAGKTVLIRSLSVPGFNVPQTVVTPGPDGSFVLPFTSCASPVVNYIQAFTPATIEWQVKIDDGNWVTFQKTDHTVYVTLNDPITSRRQESLFDISCKSAALSDNAVLATPKIWQPFSVREVKRVDGTTLKCYGDFRTESRSTDELLNEKDGQCGAWAALFIDVLRVQGLAAATLLTKVTPLSPNDKGFLIKNWTFEAQGLSNNPAYPYFNRPADPFLLAQAYSWLRPQVVDDVGLPGQSTANPASWFDSHYLVRIDGEGQYYDPSFGRTYGGLPQFDNDAIAGFFTELTVIQSNEQTVNYDINGDGAITNVNALWSVHLIRKNPPGVDIQEIPQPYPR